MGTLCHLKAVDDSHAVCDLGLFGEKAKELMFEQEQVHYQGHDTIMTKRRVWVVLHSCNILHQLGCYKYHLCTEQPLKFNLNLLL